MSAITQMAATPQYQKEAIISMKNGIIEAALTETSRYLKNLNDIKEAEAQYCAEQAYLYSVRPMYEQYCSLLREVIEDTADQTGITPYSMDYKLYNEPFLVQNKAGLQAFVYVSRLSAHAEKNAHKIQRVLQSELNHVCRTWNYDYLKIIVKLSSDGAVKLYITPYREWLLTKREGKK